MQTLDATPRRVKRKQAARSEARLERLESPERPVHEAIRPLLVELAYLRQREQLPPADVLFEYARTQLNKVRAKLEELGLPPEDIQDIHYALVAFVDEAMQADQGPLKDFWQAHLLQLELFGETRAGEGFYDRLTHLQAERRVAALRVYYLCLLFGFQGIYAHHGELERENLVESIRETLGIAIHDRIPLAPFGARPDEPAADKQRNRVLEWLAISAAGLAVVWYVGIAFSVDARARVLTDSLSRTAEDVAASVVGKTSAR
ncbi:MAG TPA: DotU family type IV/VI secretion system protein [Polyangiales bacterium]|nr:DotU family type IV/VI secretion system protein [Polyangiales bacterium]